MVWKILRPRYWILDRKVRSTNRFIILGLIAAVALGGQWIYNNWLQPNFELLNSEQMLTLVSSFIPMGIFILLLFALLGIGDITYQLYQSADTELMMTAPIPFRTIFLVKLLQASRSILVPGLFFTLLLVVFGTAQNVSPLYYLFITLIVFSAIVRD